MSPLARHLADWSSGVQVVLEWPDEDGMVAKAKKEAKKKGKPENWENYLKFNKKEGLLFKANL